METTESVFEKRRRIARDGRDVMETEKKPEEKTEEKTEETSETSEEEKADGGETSSD